jgi:hypothetical protein
MNPNPQSKLGHNHAIMKTSTTANHPVCGDFPAQVGMPAGLA